MRTEDFSAIHDMNAGGFHFGDGVLDVGGAEVDAARGVFDEVGFETALNGIESGEFDAVIGGEAADEDVGDVAGFEPFAEAGGFAMAVVKEAAVAVDLWIRSFLEYFLDARLIERCGEFGAFSVLDAMHRPESLREAVEVDLVVDLFAGMIGGEAAVIRGMPILCRDHDWERRLKFVYDGNDLITVRNSERARRHEVVLDVHQD